MTNEIQGYFEGLRDARNENSTDIRKRLPKVLGRQPVELLGSMAKSMFNLL
ncbi:hypothetical protein GCM10010916_34680 [Paenibacillus abyssi]|uniref:Uncharacterized protein n=1 Tax=Paenibacillus abyssi TaxID=1340531 RepID=A0A917LDK9_9BACL|nr:hypothetical protein GCM10010916_34680 [Paenibacillus abyssi]